MTTPLRVLLVEDSVTDEKLLLHELRRLSRAIEHRRVEDEVGMRGALAEAPWDLILSDWTMPRFDAMGALRVLRESTLDLPLIIVSGTTGEESAVDALRGGASDFVLKDRLARLLPAVERELADREVRASKRRAELALRASEQRYRRIIETTSQGVLVLVEDGRITFANHRMEQMLGVEMSALVGASILAFLSPAEHARVGAELAARTFGGAEASKTTFLHAQGGTVTGLVQSSVLLDEQSRYEGILAMVTDVTERERTAEALRRSEARFARLAESGIVGIAFASVDGPLFDANDAYLRMFGWTRAEMAAGRIDWRRMTPPDQVANDVAAMRQLAASGVAAPWEKDMLGKDGRRVPVLVGVALLDPPDCVAFVVDLTERRRTEAALRDSQQQLQQAQKMEAIGRLAGGVAHDFNNLLTVILGYAGIVLGSTGADDPIRKPLLEIERAGGRAAELTRQLLAFSRRQVLQPKIVDLDRVVAGMERMLRRLIGEDFELRLRLDGGLPPVFVDPGQIEQVVMNLVVNARDAMPQGGTVTLRTAREEPGADPGGGVGSAPSSVPREARVMLEVADTGCGMDASILSRLFEPFFTTKEVDKGTGLGLSTVLGIVQQSGGTIQVDSSVGKGSTFRIRLPEAPRDRVAEMTPRSGPPVTFRGTATVLVVEDDAPLRGLVRAILEHHGCRVLEAGSGEAALDVAKEHHGAIDLVLTDVVMPRMSGRELVEKLRPLREEARILYMSGYTDDAVVRHGVLQADVDFLQKPITPNSLVEAVRSVLARPPRAR